MCVRFQAEDENLPESHFAASWSGLIEIKNAGEYMLSTSSKDGSYLWVDGKLVLNNGGLHGTEEKQANVSMTAGFHDFKVEYFNAEGDATCIAQFSGPDTGGHLQPITGFHSPGPSEMDYTPVRSLLQSEGLSPGFSGEYYFFGDDRVSLAPNLGVLEPSLSKVTSAINFQTGEDFKALDDSISSFDGHFAARWSGLLEIEKEGNYTFSLTSDDGAFLWLDDHLVINHGGTDRAQVQSSSVTLEAGYHRIRIEFYNDEGSPECTAKYRGPDTDEAEMVVPAWHME